MMTRRLLSLTALAGLVLSAAAPVAAEDQAVTDRLDQAGLKYEIDEDGDYKLVFNYSKEGRTQIVFVSGGTQTLGDLTIREVFAPAGRVDKDKIGGAKALELLRESGNNKVGSWEVRGDVLYFVIKVFDTMTAAELSTMLDVAAETADNMEIELSGARDDL